ncbi:MAG TPA: cyclic nucleotide-binding domain-containing protein [Allosphingosinicella sp.]|nr:cyclic nucleotide-binding domain-containing protein [Allosphingosinicella sp.]
MLSPDALVLQSSYALLVAAMLAPRLARARMLVAIAAAIALGHAWWNDDTVTMLWMALLLATCLIVIVVNLQGDRNIRFDAEEQAMVERLFSDLPRRSARHVLDQGMFLNGQDGDELTREGEPVHHLYYLASGEARVISMGRQVGLCHAGDLVGEITVLSGEPASASVVLNGPARFWCAPAEELRPYVEANEDVRRALEHGFAASLRAKLRASNRTIAEAGGVKPTVG